MNIFIDSNHQLNKLVKHMSENENAHNDFKWVTPINGYIFVSFQSKLSQSEIKRKLEKTKENRHVS